MKKHRKIIAILLLLFCLCVTCAAPAYAITEDEVQQQVDSEGKEAVSGNIFIWFLCAIAFLKASQKIDSFMSSLGINVGHTGGSMLAEAMIATRGVAALRGGIGGHFSAKGGASGGGGGPGGGDGGAGGFLSGGLVGAVGRQFTRGAASSVTGQGGGVTAGISRKMYESSLSKGGDFANKVTGAVAKGRVATAGTMTGPTAAAAMASYFGVRQAGSMGAAAAGAVAADEYREGPEYGGSADFEGSPGVGSPPPSGASESGIHDAPGGGAFDHSGDAGGSYAPEMGFSPHIPSYTDVEIGGGRVTGVETTPEQPGGVQFAMYSAEQYSRPTGEHSTVEAVDGSKWYKQYARDTVDRTPYMDEEGEIKYHEKIVKTLPKPPSRKDRM